METITFQCSKCQKVMRISADNAGKRAKCSKCGQGLVIPQKSQPLNTGGAAQQSSVALFGEEDESVYKFAEEAAPDAKGEKKDEKFKISDLYDVDEDEEDEDDEDDEEEEKKEREAMRLLSQRR